MRKRWKSIALATTIVAIFMFNAVQQEYPVSAACGEADSNFNTTSFSLQKTTLEESICPPLEGGHIEKIDDLIFGGGENKGLKVSLRKNEVSIMGKSGNKCGKISYTIPFLTVDLDDSINQEAVEKINQYFESDMADFWNRSDTSEIFNKAQSYAQNNAKCQPIYSSEVMTQIVYVNKEIFSVRQIKHWYSGGTISDLECGMTFSLRTGERMSVEEFINCPLDDFCMQIVDFLYKEIPNLGLSPSSKEELVVRYNSSSLNTYQFFVCEENLYIPLPSAYSSEADKIICWSIDQQKPYKLFLGHTSTTG